MSVNYRICMVCLVAGLLLLSLAAVPMNAKAETYYYVTSFPSANNSTYQYNYGKLQYGPVPCTGITKASDTYKQVVQAPYSGVLYTMTSNDYTRADWVDPEWGGYVGTLPPDGANISAVWVVALFTYQYPDLYLHYSIDGGDTYNTSDVIESDIYTWQLPYTAVMWNVTSLETWTPALVNNTDLFVKLTMTPPYGVYYSIDYLGIRLTWSIDEEEGEGSEDPPDDPESGEGGWNFTYDFIMLDGGLVGVLGLVGFIGIIAIPAGAIVIYRNDPGEGRINLFIKMLAMWMFCLTLVMVNFSGA